MLPISARGSAGAGPVSPTLGGIDSPLMGAARSLFATRWARASLCATVTVSFPALAEPTADLRGDIRARNFANHYSPHRGDNLHLDFGSQLRARPELTVQLNDSLSTVATVRAYRDFGSVVTAAQTTSGYSLDRLYFDYQDGAFDYRVGRQALHYGVSQIWNPVDLIDSQNPLDAQFDPNGVNALSASVGLSPTCVWHAVVAFPFDQPLSLTRLQWLWGTFDVSVLAADVRHVNERVLGLTAKGDIEVGVWLESAYHFSPPRDYLEFVVGIDYSLALLESIYLSLQYYRDESGGSSFEDYDYLALLTGQRTFLARQYASFAATANYNEETSVRGTFILNLEDGSSVAALGFRRYITDALELQLNVQSLQGLGNGEFSLRRGHPLVNIVPVQTAELSLYWYL